MPVVNSLRFIVPMLQMDTEEEKLKWEEEKKKKKKKVINGLFTVLLVVHCHKGGSLA